MEFEYIDESEIEYTTPIRQKKTPSLFDSNLEDRNYWGNDPGSYLTMSLVRVHIRKMIKNLRLMNVDTDDMTARLSKEHRNELRIYQLEMLKFLITKDKYTIVQDDDGEYVINIIEPYYEDANN